MKQGAIVAIASFADTEDDCVASGAGLVRMYLDHAFGVESKSLIPGLHLCPDTHTSIHSYFNLRFSPCSALILFDDQMAL